MRHRLGRLMIPALLAAAPAAAAAQTAAPAAPAAKPKISELELLLTAATDYRFRGVSQTNRRPALQAQLTFTAQSGVYVQAFASNVADTGGAHAEVDLALGYGRDLGPLALDGGVVAYLYPGGRHVDYVELYSSVGTAIGPGKIALALNYAPRQSVLGHQDNLYVALNGQAPIPRTKLTLRGSFGIEDGAFGSGKRDWMVGADAELLGFKLGLQYVDTAHTGGDPNAKAAAIVSLSKRM